MFGACLVSFLQHSLLNCTFTNNTDHNFWRPQFSPRTVKSCIIPVHAGKFLLKSSSFRPEGFDLKAEARNEKPLSVSLQHDSLENKSFSYNSRIINEHHIWNLLCTNCYMINIYYLFYTKMALKHSNQVLWKCNKWSITLISQVYRMDPSVSSWAASSQNPALHCQKDLELWDKSSPDRAHNFYM